MERESWRTLVVRIPTPAPVAIDTFRVEHVRPECGAGGLSPVLARSLQRGDALAQLRVVRHRLEQNHGATGRIFAVTSARAGEGKSTVAAQLAYVLSEAQRARVLLVEATLARPGLASVIGLGVPEHLAFSTQILQKMHGGVAPWSVLDVNASLSVIAERQGARPAPHALYSANFANLVRGAATVFDYVVIDTPEVLGSGDAGVVTELAGGVILVARGGVSLGSDVREAHRALQGKVSGVVLVGAAA